MAIWFAVDVIVVVFFARWSSPHQCCQSSRCNQPANPAYLLLLAYTLKRKHAHTQVRWLTDRTDHHHTLRCEWAWACVALRCYSAHHLQICFFFCCCLQCSRNSFEIRFCTQHTTHGLKMKWDLKARDLLHFLRRMFAIKVLFVLWQTAGVCRCVTFCAVCARCESSDNFIDGR